MTTSITTRLSLPGFEGTLDELSRVTSDGRLAVEKVPMVSVAAQLAAQLVVTHDVDLEDVGDGLLVGASLLALKSSRLIAQPEPDQEAEPVVPRKRADGLTALVDWLGVRQGRESLPPLTPPSDIPRPVQPRPAAELRRAWSDVVSREREPVRPVTVPTFARVEAVISRLIRVLKGQRRLSLRQILRRRNRGEAVLHFLAVLELVRGGRATAVQEHPFGDVIVEIGDDTGARADRAG